MLSVMGAPAFADRARRELQATGETVRKRTVETVSELTAQEAYIARLAVDGRTNLEIGAQLYLSARTVEWHLRKVYTKLGVGSRRELRWALAKLGQADPRGPSGRRSRPCAGNRPARPGTGSHPNAQIIRLCTHRRLRRHTLVSAQAARRA
jgi:DNA-binding CsgD family transcriptional regulator